MTSAAARSVRQLVKHWRVSERHFYVLISRRKFSHMRIGGKATMSDSESSTPSITLDAAQLALVDQFQRDRALASRDAAIALLLDIAFEAATGRGRRFWDKPIVGQEPEPPEDRS